jgi:hypothetical protein
MITKNEVTQIPHEVKIKEFIKPLKNFQYSVNIAYDLNSEEKIKNYIPTLGGLEIIENIILSTLDNATDRAHILVGAYGKGKSQLVLSLLALLNKKDKTLFKNILNKTKAANQKLYEFISDYICSDKKLLPIVIDGNSNNLSQLFLSSLSKALSIAGIEGLTPSTYFDAAIDKIADWKKNYKDTYANFAEKISSSVEEFVKLLKNYNQTIYNEFLKIYPSLTSGSIFTPLSSVENIVDIYYDIAKKVKKYGYNGIYVVYDEFSKFLESGIKDTAKSDIKMFQDFAERCSRSGGTQMHLMLITHKHIQNYIDELPKERIDAWSGVENRFTKIDIVNHNSQIYDIIGQVIKKEKPYDEFKKAHASQFAALVDITSKSRAFNDIDKKALTGLVESVYPLEPFSLFLLPHISEKVAQNERTVFTFLASNQKNTLVSFLNEESGKEFPLITADYIYDYFEALFKKDDYKRNVNKIWQKATNIVSRLDDKETLAIKVVKTIALIEILDQPSKLQVTREILRTIFYSSYDSLEFDKTISYLTNKHAIAIKSSGDLVVLIDENVVDMQRDLQDSIMRSKKSFDAVVELNKFVEHKKCLYPTSYNDEKDITRFFDIKFISEAEVLASIETLPTSEVADGRVYLIKNSNKRINPQTVDKIQTLKCKTQNCVFVTVSESDNIDDELLKRKGLLELENEYAKNKTLNVAAEYEIKTHKEELLNILEKFLADYLYPERGRAVYYYNGERRADIKRKSNLNGLLSEICRRLFKDAPVVKSELINRNIITSNGRNAINKVVEGLLANNLNKNLGLTGYGPEVSVKKTVLDSVGITRTDGVELTRNATDLKVKNILDKIDEMLIRTKTNGKISINEIVERLRSVESGIGLKKWLFPIYFAVVLHFYKKQTVLFYQDKECELSSKNIEFLTDAPNDYYIKLVAWDTASENYIKKLEQVFSNYVYDAEKEFNSFDYIVKAMQRWYVKLPKYVKEYVKATKQEKKFRNYLMVADINANELLFESLPELFNLEIGQDLAKKIKSLKELFDTQINAEITNLATWMVGVLSPKKDLPFISALKNWNGSIRKETKAYMLNGDSDELFRIIEIADNDEIETVKSIIRLVTGLRIEDWEQSAPQVFMDKFKELIKEINDKNEERKNTVSGNSYRIITVDANGKNIQERNLEKISLSPKTKLFENDILTQIDEFGDSISLNEKRLVLMQIIEKLK